VQLACIGALAGCGSDTTQRAVPITGNQLALSLDSADVSALGSSLARVVIAPRTVPPVLVGGTTALTATVYNATGTPFVYPTRWSSSDTTVAVVTSTGLVTTRRSGTVFIKAGTNERFDSVSVNVISAPVKTVTVSAAASILLGDSARAVAYPVDSAGAALTGRAVTWSSRSATIARVSSTGVITGVAAGSATIDAVVGGVTGSANVTVTKPVVVTATVKTIGVTLAASSIATPTTTQATAILKDSVGNLLTNRAIAWSSANAAVATVSASGIVTAVGIGSAAITAQSGAVSGRATVTVTAPPTSSFKETLAALPLVYLNTTLPAAPAAGGVVISATTPKAFAAALIAAKPGDVIELSNGVTYAGNFILPNKNTTSTNWITIRPADQSRLSAPGARMTPTIAAAARLPVILSNTTIGGIATAPGAHHYRLIGLEVGLASGVPYNTGLIRFGEDGSNGQVTLASIPHDIVLDRAFVHGTSTQIVRRCITLNSASTAVIDSYVSDCHDKASDAQAIAGWNGPGPFKIVNNYLEGSAENISFGGADPGIPNLVPSDIEVRGNHLSRPAAWKGVWMVKNIFELKNAQRVLLEGNILENNWLDGQGGSAIVLKSTDQSGGCPWCGTRDVTVRFNLIRNTGAGFALSAAPDPGITNFRLQRITITDNVVENIDASPTFNGDGRGFLINQDVTDVTVAHNTLISPSNSAVTFGGPVSMPAIRLSIRDNIMGGGIYGVKGPGLTPGTPTITALMPNGFFAGNVIIQASGAGYPAGNFFPATTTAVGFVSASALDFHLTSASTSKGKGTDGRDPGADVSALMIAIQNVIVP
jgi:uncharacterized protein YjdB